MNLSALVLKAAFIVVSALLCGGTAMAEDDPRPEDPASLLFEAPQWAAARPGATLSYRYSRRSANDALYGPSFEDRIRLHIEKGDAEATRTVRVELFGRERRRAAGPFEDVSSNPVLMLFLEHHLEQLSRSVHANPRYLKNAIRAALRDKYRIEAGESLVDGRPVKTWRVLIAPFIDDPNKARMNGLEGLAYTLAVSEEVPGQVTELAAKATRPDGVAALEETLVYEATDD
ncbi:MAG: hypothetical protein ACJ8EC_05445 [Microvirga sp.]